MQALWQLVKDPDIREVIRRLELENAKLAQRVAALENQLKK